MKPSFSITSLLLLAIACCCCTLRVTAAPTTLDSTNVVGHHVVAQVSKHGDDALLLVRRSLSYPVESNDALVSKIMTSVKNNLDTNVFAAISAKFCEKAAASLKVHADILGGLIKVKDVHVNAIESVAIDHLKSTFEASLNAEIQTHIYDALRVNLRKSCSNHTTLDKAKLLVILTELQAQAKSLIHAQLPQIGLNLGVHAKEQVEVAVKGVEVNVPLILQIAVDVALDERAALETSVDAAVNISAKINAEAAAKAVIDVL